MLDSSLTLFGFRNPAAASSGFDDLPLSEALHRDVRNDGRSLRPVIAAGHDRSYNERLTAGSGTAFAVRFNVTYLSMDSGSNWISIGAYHSRFFSSTSPDGGYFYASTFGEEVLRLAGPF